MNCTVVPSGADGILGLIVIVWARERLTHASSDAEKRMQRSFKHPPGAERASDLEEAGLWRYLYAIGKVPGLMVSTQPDAVMSVYLWLREPG